MIMKPYGTGKSSGAYEQGVKTASDYAGVTSQLAEIAQYLSTPIATYTHSTNKEVIVSAVDVSTNTFTSVGHGLQNGNRLNPTMNINSGVLYPQSVYPGGLASRDPAYYVVNKTDDTFQISTTSGGAAIDLTTNAAMDLTKWHFEIAVNVLVTIANLGNLKRCRLRIYGKMLNKSSDWLEIVPGICATVTNEFVHMELPAADFGRVRFLHGDAFNSLDILIDSRKYLNIRAQGVFCQSNSATANTSALIATECFSPKYYNQAFTSIVLKGVPIANGFTVEVFSV